jgi:hypothetical protein
MGWRVEVNAPEVVTKPPPKYFGGRDKFSDNATSLPRISLELLQFPRGDGREIELL